MRISLRGYGGTSMTAIITDVKYRMALSLIRDLADAGIPVIACHSGEGRPYAFDAKGVIRTAILPDPDKQPEACLEIAKFCREELGWNIWSFTVTTE